MKIVIVGGGTAGWISALILSKVCKDIHQITLIESEKIKTIGVGEGSTGFLRGIINNEVFDYGCNELEFIKYTNGTPKNGILFKNWNGDSKDYFEPIDSPFTENTINGYPLLCSYVANNIDPSQSSIDGRITKGNLSPFYIENNKLLHDRNHAHHFDAKLAAKYFEKIAGNKIKKIKDDVTDIILDENNFVKELVLTNGNKIYGDFFIDASGFSRIFSSKMNVKFIKFNEMTLNSAIPFRLNLDQYDNSQFYTVSWAQKFGWLWMIPKTDNIGCGYIYDDRYTDEDKAKKEIENILNKEIEIIKKISFSPGRLSQPWNNNVLSIGLSYQFLEPLEATSIHATIAQLNYFVFYFLNNTVKETVINSNIESYNLQMNKMIENFRSFILFHYYNKRSDTDFWKKMNESAINNKEINRYIEILQDRLLSPFDIENIYGGVSNELFNWVACSLGIFSKDSANRQILKNNIKKIAKIEEEILCEYMANKKWVSSNDFLNLI